MNKAVESTTCLIENHFDCFALPKLEALMTQGNGYMGSRASLEEEYIGSIRGFYIAGTYNKDSKYEVAELPNLPDVIAHEISLDDNLFRLDCGKILEYKRTLDLTTGEIVRNVLWQSPDEKCYMLLFRRFVSHDNLNLIVSEIQITPLLGDCRLVLKTGINGRVTNSGAQNMYEVEKRIYQNKYMQYIGKTTQSELDVIITSTVESNMDSSVGFTSERRRLFAELSLDVPKGKTVTITKRTVVTTSLDSKYMADYKQELAKMDSMRMMQLAEAKSYAQLLDESVSCFNKMECPSVKSTNRFDELALNFATYHLKIMVPAHDKRFSIGAKGLSGEGYKAHVFWDTEIFLLPFYLHNNPQAAKNLLLYRHATLEVAKKKAKDKGYNGALFPWESALTGQEETPEFAAMNIKTGTRERVHSADKEHHIVADIAYAVLEYEKITCDTDFMQEAGLELLIESSRFWVSRADKSAKPYMINDVIGPDEYTEHINNNAYTNYMASYIVSKTLEKIEQYDITVYDKNDFIDFVDNIHQPKPTKNGVIPQDDSFLDKSVIDITKYREKPGKQLILKDYTRREVVAMQVLKQADAVMLLYTLPHLFDARVHAATLNYYEPKTIHDSSLSMCMHSIVAARLGEVEKAYDFFEQGARVDLGVESDSKDGIHAAAQGAIYLAVVTGFAGIQILPDEININPMLPEKWEEIKLSIFYKNTLLRFKINKKRILITRLNNENHTISIKCLGKEYNLQENTHSLEISGLWRE